MASAKTIAIVSGKGGTGKSIIATSMGYLLSYCGFKTLLIDMDLFTSGLTYYALGDSPRRFSVALRDLFISPSTDIPSPVKLQNEFCHNNLFLIPSVTGRRVKTSELQLSTNFFDLATFTRRVKDLLSHYEKEGFDYILVDTRGGSDLTSIGTAIATRSIIVVTEADKPSWDMGHVLLDAIDEAERDCDVLVERLGFIINKNVLPSEAIEVYLKKEWQCSHLATIPLDANVIRYFQEDKVPIAEEIGADFDISIMQIISTVCQNDLWSDEQSSDLSNLKHNAYKQKKENVARVKRTLNIESFSKWNRIYFLVIILTFFILINFDDQNIFHTNISIPFKIMVLFIFLMVLPDLLFFVRKLQQQEAYKKRHLQRIIDKK